MIVTHTTSADGQQRVYLGGKASLECWIEPQLDGIGWSLHAEIAPGTYPLPAEDMRAWMTHLLLALAKALTVAPADLKAVPFERIAALHTGSPQDYRRIPVPRRQINEHGFMATPPNITRPRADFTTHGFAHASRRRG